MTHPVALVPIVTVPAVSVPTMLGEPVPQDVKAGAVVWPLAICAGTPEPLPNWVVVVPARTVATVDPALFNSVQSPTLPLPI